MTNNRQGDSYERRHMSDDGVEQIVYRDKFIAPWPFHLFMFVIFLVSVVPMLIIPNIILALAIALPYLLLWILFSVLRVTVSTSHVHVQLGPFGPKIPIEAIESVVDVDYDWKKFGGWGIRKSRDGEKAYNMMGDAGRAVRIVYRDKGERHTMLLTSGESALLADIIQQTISAHDASNTDDVVLDFDVATEQETQQSAQHETETISS